MHIKLVVNRIKPCKTEKEIKTLKKFKKPVDKWERWWYDSKAVTENVSDKLRTAHTNTSDFAIAK